MVKPPGSWFFLVLMELGIYLLLNLKPATRSYRFATFFPGFSTSFPHFSMFCYIFFHISPQISNFFSDLFFDFSTFFRHFPPVFPIFSHFPRFFPIFPLRSPGATASSAGSQRGTLSWTSPLWTSAWAPWRSSASWPAKRTAWGCTSSSMWLRMDGGMGIWMVGLMKYISRCI